MKEPSFARALLISLLLHSCLLLGLTVSYHINRSDLAMDALPGQARMRFAFSEHRPGTGPGPVENQQAATSTQVDPGLLAREISNIMRKMPYPELARRMGMQGLVVFQIQTDAEGRVAEIQKLESSGYPLLDSTTASHLKDWVFPFANQTFSIPVRFVLK